MIRYTTRNTALGETLIAASDAGVCAVWPLAPAAGADNLEATLLKTFPGDPVRRDDAGLTDLAARVAQSLEQDSTDASLPLDLRGTPFQQSVWRSLQDIPAGTTVSYASLARKLGKPRAVRAVAGACAANRVAVLVPCHRVVRSDGGLSGYRWGVERKQALLAQEARASA
ncbi:methylated-DNA--[protein]-cysteine S-methyltransferase [Marinobacter sp. C2H3]|uniref:methylated-DNA--[protein]-cysteine S-methyltransferase n=1 Tax=Marinobacter sp. C2H3 TaxID=3119003 RepID=UPI00300E9D02